MLIFNYRDIKYVIYSSSQYPVWPAISCSWFYYTLYQVINYSGLWSWVAAF